MGQFRYLAPRIIVVKTVAIVFVPLSIQNIITSNHFNQQFFVHRVVYISGPLVATAWRVLRLRMDEMASRYGG
jgi:hypothetical protein